MIAFRTLWLNIHSNLPHSLFRGRRTCPSLLTMRVQGFAILTRLRSISRLAPVVALSAFRAAAPL